MEHTQGPWVVSGSERTLRLTVRAQIGDSMRNVCVLTEGPNDLGNAKLIAAAPAMLAALRLYFSEPARFNKAASDALAMAQS